MLGDAVLYAASRATSAAVDNASRRVAWAATASGFLLCALVSALIVAYWLIEPRVGTLNAVALISAACAAAGVLSGSCSEGSPRCDSEKADCFRANAVSTILASVPLSVFLRGSASRAQAAALSWDCRPAISLTRRSRSTAGCSAGRTAELAGLAAPVILPLPDVFD